MAKRRWKYLVPEPGEVFEAPVNERRSLVGVVIASANTDIVTAFLDFTIEKGSHPDPATLTPDRILSVMRHGPLGFNDDWKVVAALDRFDPAEWPPLKFYVSGSDAILEFDRKTLRLIGRTSGSGNHDGYPDLMMSGDEYIEKVLARQLGEEWRSRRQ